MNTVDLRGLSAAALKMAEEAGKKGITTADVQAATGRTIKAAGTCLRRMIAAGKLTMRTEIHAGKRVMRCWPIGVEPPPRADCWTIRGDKPRKAYESKALRLDPRAAAVVPKTVKVTVLPTPQDTRYRFDPPPGWRGEITRAWLQQRLEARR